MAHVNECLITLVIEELWEICGRIRDKKVLGLDDILNKALKLRVKRFEFFANTFEAFQRRNTPFPVSLFRWPDCNCCSKVARGGRTLHDEDGKNSSELTEKGQVDSGGLENVSIFNN